MRYAIAYHEANGKGFSKTEPYIHDEFKNDNKDECLKVASEMVDDGYCLVTPFIIDDKREYYDWEYVNAHKVIKIEE